MRFNSVRGFFVLLHYVYVKCPSIAQTEFWRVVIDLTRRDAGLANVFPPAIPPMSARTFLHFSSLLIGLDQTEPFPSTGTAMVYEHAVAILEWVYEATIIPNNHAHANARWRFTSCLLSGEFSSLVRNLDPRALAIFAHIVALERLPSLTRTWSSMRYAELMVRALSELIHPDWAWAMEWPLSVAGGKTGAQSQTSRE